MGVFSKKGQGGNTSDFSIRNLSQGGAYTNNLIVGDITIGEVLNRATPYHIPRSTEMKGFAVIYGGDDRWYNNILLGRNHGKGLEKYNNHTTSIEEYIEKVQQYAPTDLEGFMDQKAPVYINNNTYLRRVNLFFKEESALLLSEELSFQLISGLDGITIELEYPEELIKKLGEIQL